MRKAISNIKRQSIFSGIINGIYYKFDTSQTTLAQIKETVDEEGYTVA